MTAKQKNEVLVVEPDPETLDQLIETLAAAGFEVEIAMAGETALKWVRGTAPGVVVCAAELPDIDALGLLRQWDGNIPLIVLTRGKGGQYRAQLLDAGAMDVIDKPFHGAELVARVRRCLKVRNLLLGQIPVVRAGGEPAPNGAG